jgi:hypothetical protein
MKQITRMTENYILFIYLFIYLLPLFIGTVLTSFFYKMSLTHSHTYYSWSEMHIFQNLVEINLF